VLSSSSQSVMSSDKTPFKSEMAKVLLWLNGAISETQTSLKSEIAKSTSLTECDEIQNSNARACEIVTIKNCVSKLLTKG